MIMFKLHLKSCTASCLKPDRASFSYSLPRVNIIRVSITLLFRYELFQGYQPLTTSTFVYTSLEN